MTAVCSSIQAQIYEFLKPRQVAIAFEPESAALHVRSVRHEQYLARAIQNAKMYIVIDIGGGRSFNRRRASSALLLLVVQRRNALMLRKDE